MLELMLVWAHLGVEILTYHGQLNDLLPLPQSRRIGDGRLQQRDR